MGVFQFLQNEITGAGHAIEHGVSSAYNSVSNFVKGGEKNFAQHFQQNIATPIAAHITQPIADLGFNKHFFDRDIAANNLSSLRSNISDVLPKTYGGGFTKVPTLAQVVLNSDNPYKLGQIRNTAAENNRIFLTGLTPKGYASLSSEDQQKFKQIQTDSVIAVGGVTGVPEDSLKFTKEVPTAQLGNGSKGGLQDIPVAKNGLDITPHLISPGVATESAVATPKGITKVPATSLAGVTPPSTKGLTSAKPLPPKASLTYGVSPITGEVGQLSAPKAAAAQKNLSQTQFGSQPPTPPSNPGKPFAFAPDLQNVPDPKGLVQKFNEIMAPVKNLPQDLQTTYTDWANAHTAAPQKGIDVSLKANQLATDAGISNHHDFIDRFQAGQAPKGHLTNYIKQVTNQLLANEHAAGIETPAQANYMYQTYLKDPNAPVPTGKSLGQNPGFAKERTFTSYKEAGLNGYIPKHATIGDILAARVQASERAIAARNLFTEMGSKGYIAPAREAPYNWKEITGSGFPRDTHGAPYKASPVVARTLNSVFGESTGPVARTLKVTAKVAQEVQHALLNAGIPGTPLNGHIIGQLFKESATGKFGVFSEFFRSFSNGATKANMRANRPLITALSERGVSLGFKSPVKENVPQTTSGVIKNVASSILNKVFGNEATFNRFFPNMQLRTARQVYEQGIKKGMSVSEAHDLAASVVKNYYGVESRLLNARASEIQDALGTIFFAPRFREAYVNVFKNTYDAFKPGNIKDPAYSLNRKFLFGMIASYLAYNELNKKLNNGKGMSENAPGREFYLSVPYGNGKILYIPFGPSILTVPRALASIATSLAKDDRATAIQSAGALFSSPIQEASQLISNKDYYDNPIYKPGQSAGAKAAATAEYFGGQANPWIHAVIDYLQGKSPAEAASVGLGLPAKFSDTNKAAAASHFNNVDEAKLSLSGKNLDFFNALNDSNQNSAGDKTSYQKNQATSAVIMLTHPEVFAAMQKVAQADTGPTDPVFAKDLTPQQSALILSARSGNTADRGLLEKQPWYSGYAHGEDQYYASLPKSTATNGPVAPIVPQGVQPLVDKYYSLPSGSNARTSLVLTNPPLRQYLQAYDEYKNQERQALNLPITATDLKNAGQATGTTDNGGGLSSGGVTLTSTPSTSLGSPTLKKSTGTIKSTSKLGTGTRKASSGGGSRVRIKTGFSSKPRTTPVRKLSGGTVYKAIKPLTIHNAGAKAGRISLAAIPGTHARGGVRGKVRSRLPRYKA